MAVDGKITIDTEVDPKGADKGLKTLESKLRGTADKASAIGQNMSKYITAPFLALGGIGMKAASDLSGANRTIQAQLGVTGEEADKLTEKAQNIYKAGFGESMDETARAVSDVKKNLGDLASEAELEGITKDAMVLAETMEEDVNWVARAAGTLMREFGDDSTKAFDLITWGSQNGLNFSQELLDNISEYGPLFSEMGYSSEEYFALLKAGAEEGAYNLDYVNDVMKEFQARVKDGSEKTSDAMAMMSEDTQKVFQNFLDGKATVKDVSNAVLGELGTMDNKVLANQIGVELYGTKFEDLEADAVLALGNVEGGLENVDGAMGKITDAQEESFGKRFRSLLRETQTALLPLGEVLMGLAEKALPPLISMVTKLGKWFSNLSGPVQTIIIAFGALLAALGPLLAIISPIILMFASLSAAAIGWGAAILGIVAVIAVVAVLIVMYWDEIKAFTISLWNGLVEFLKAVWDGIVAIFKIALEFVVNVITSYWNMTVENTMVSFNLIKEIISLVLTGIKTYFQTLFNIYITIFTTSWNIIKTVTTTIFNGIVAFIKLIWNGIKLYFTTMFNLYVTIITTAWNLVKTVTSAVFNAIMAVIKTIWNGIKTVFTTTINIIKSITTAAWDWIKTTTNAVFNAILNIIRTVWDSIKTFFTSNLNAIKSIVQNIWNNIKTTTQSIWNGILNFFSGVWRKLVSGVNGVRSGFISAWNAIKNGMRSPINGMIRMVNGLISGIERGLGSISGAFNGLPSITVPDWVPKYGGKSFSLPRMPSPSLPRIPSLDVGTNFVARDGLAFLHAGEAVVPKAYNPAADGERNNTGKQPMNVTFTLGGKDYEAYVDDITETQERKKFRLKRK